MLKRFLGNQRGATAIEYAMIAGLISLAIIAGVSLWSDKVTAMFGVIAYCSRTSLRRTTPNRLCHWPTAANS